MLLVIQLPFYRALEIVIAASEMPELITQLHDIMESGDIS